VNDLLEKLEAAMNERARVIEGSGYLGWLIYRNPDGSMRYTTAAGSQPLDEPHWCVDGKDAVGFASAQVVHDEKQAWRRLARDRKLLARHKPELDARGRLVCACCRTDHTMLGEWDNVAQPVLWPCYDVRDLAEEYDIEVPQ
jgi:hypothetical protein